MRPKKINENSYHEHSKNRVIPQLRGALKLINNNAEYINLYETEKSMVESFEDSVDMNLNEQVKHLIQGS